MKLPRRQFLRLAAVAGAFPALPRAASALDYPTRPVRIIVGFAPGSTTDILGRLIGQWLSTQFGQPFVIDNRPGAGGNVGTEAVVNSAADGYTLLMVAPANTINMSLYDKLSFDFMHDMAPVSGIVRVPNVLEVNPSLPVNTVPEFIAYAKSHSGTLSFASAGVGTTSHMAGELFDVMAGVDLVPVHYRGDGPAMVDLIGGQVQVGFATMVASIAYIRAGKLRPLAVTTAARSPILPDLPTVGDFVSGYEASSAFGVAAPRDTPVAIVAILNKAINAGLADPAIAARLADLGGVALTGSAVDYGKFLADDVEKWRKVIRAANIKAE
jgi:tripartite-type tricarboxylate transporter receptor subunit TctC